MWRDHNGSVTPPVHGTGIWSAAFRYGDASRAAEAASELEALGYTALWLPDAGGDLFAAVENVMAATRTVTVATGILNLWLRDPAETAARHARLTQAHGPRFLVGIGVSHQPLVEGMGVGVYEHPLERMRRYLDDLDAATPPLARGDRVLAALRPRMTALARERSAGIHPYLVTVEHTARARQDLGPGPLLAPELGVALEADAGRARALARAHLAIYITLPNYTGNWLRMGFDEHDLADGGSDRLVDALVAWGDEDAIAARVAAHRQAGADHVCVQVLTDDPTAPPLDEWRRLAPVLTS